MCLVPLASQVFLTSPHIAHWDGRFILKEPKAIVEWIFPQYKKHQVLYDAPFRKAIIVAIGIFAIGIKAKILY